MSLFLTLALQQIAVAPYPGEVGGEAVVRAYAEAGPIAGLHVTAEWADGSRSDVGVTDGAGQLRIVPELVGTHRLAAEWQGIRLVAPFPVVPAQPRWQYAVACVPLGMMFLAVHLRAARGGRRRAVK